MKYLLGLTFNYKFFKKPAVIRFSSDNKLIDELILDHDIDSNVRIGHKRSMADKFIRGLTKKYHDHNSFYFHMSEKIKNKQKKNLQEQIPSLKLGKKKAGKENILDWAPARKNNSYDEKVKPNTRVYFFPNKMFLYEVEGDNLGESIDIDCRNDNNNYTNGFMTKYSHFTFRCIFLIPKKILENSQHCFELFSRLHKGDLMENSSFALGNFNKNNIWPLAISGIEVSGMPNNCAFYHENIGGNFKIKIPLIRKHRIIMCGDHTSSVGRLLFWPEIIENILYFKLLNIFDENK